MSRDIGKGFSGSRPVLSESVVKIPLVRGPDSRPNLEVSPPPDLCLSAFVCGFNRFSSRAVEGDNFKKVVYSGQFQHLLHRVPGM